MGAAGVITRSTAKATSARTTTTSSSLRSSLTARWDQVVLCRDDLPTAAPAYPGVREPIAATEQALGPVAVDHQPSRDDGRPAEALALLVLFRGRLDCIWSRHDIAQHVVATDR